MADYQYILSTGVIVPDTSTLLDEVTQEWLDVFGADLVTTPDTPQGAMIVSETAARERVLANNAALANQINPNIATGVFADALCALMGLERDAGVATEVTAILAGVPGTNIPAGIAKASDATGQLYTLAGSVVIDVAGTVEGTFLCDALGPIACPAGALNRIVATAGVLGWESVTNPADGILGRLEQSTESLLDERRVTLARQGISTVEAQVSDLYALDGVRSLAYRENVAATTQIIDGISLVAHSVWACVDGGTDLDIATSLLQNKTDGANWNGAVVLNVVEPASGQTYVVKFDRPDEIQFLVRVTVRQGLDTSNPLTAVIAAVLNYVAGNIPGDRGLVVGAPVSPFDIAGGISYYHPAMDIVSVEVAPVSTGVYQTTEYAIALDEVARVQSGAITVVLL